MCIIVYIIILYIIIPDVKTAFRSVLRITIDPHSKSYMTDAQAAAVYKQLYIDIHKVSSHLNSIETPLQTS